MIKLLIATVVSYWVS